MTYPKPPDSLLAAVHHLLKVTRMRRRPDFVPSKRWLALNEELCRRIAKSLFNGEKVPRWRLSDEYRVPLPKNGRVLYYSAFEGNAVYQPYIVFILDQS